MAIVINGSGTVTGISVGGLPDDIVDAGTLANDAVGLAQMAAGTDGNIITYDTSGNPAVVATGSSGQILTSAGADAVPTFAAGGLSSGNINNVFRFHVTDGGMYENSSATSKVSFDAISWSAVSGRIYVIQSIVDCRPKKDTTGSAKHVSQEMRAYYGTTDRSQGDTTFDTRINTSDYIGFTLVAAPAANVYGYFPYSVMGAFTAGSTATHYFYVTQKWNYDNTTSRCMSAADSAPWVTTIYEVLP